MRNIIIVVLAILVSSMHTNAQYVTLNQKVILFDSLSINELKENGWIADQVTHQNQILFLEVVANGIKNQYYKSSDSTYYYRSFYEGKSYEEGQLILDTMYFGKIDTFFTFCTPEEMIIEKNIFSLKSGKWIKTTPSGEKYFGNYLKGKKQGIWTKVNFKNEKSQIEYSNDQIVNLTNRYPYETKEFLSEFRNVVLTAQFDNTIELAENIIIRPKQTSDDNSNSFRFELRDDDQIQLSRQPKGGMKINGSYDYFTNTFTFDVQKTKIKFEIAEIGKSKIRLERKN